ncbi:MAG: O-antigen ligase family protein, partial [Pseudomonas sp.]
AVSEFSAWQPQQAAGEENSVGLRMEWYKNSLDIVREHPIFGAGTGGFPKAYAEKTLGSGKLVPAHPHNEYLLIAVQLGLVGLALLFYLFYRQWRLASSLPLALEQNLARGLLLTIIFGCLFNSLLVDHTEGLLYAWLSGLLYGGLNSSDNPANMTQ